MQAWQVIKRGEPIDVMEFGEKAVPEPGTGEVRIQVKAVALGLPDVFMCRGTYAFNPALPLLRGKRWWALSPLPVKESILLLALE
jgi:NADPH:quinone reductase